MMLTHGMVRELLDYNPETGVFTWRERGRHWFKTDRACSAWNTRYAGQRAGGVSARPNGGYQCRQIRLLGSIHYEHHLAWLCMTDEPLPAEIDHEGRDATDNRWRNLRAATHADNQRNKSMRLDNTSGVTGVSWHKQRGKWQAYCNDDGRRTNLGLFAEIDEAARVVAEFRSAHGFDPGHGAELAHYHQECAP